MKRKPTKPTITHTCGECAHGVMDEKFINKDINGKPFLIRCPFCTQNMGARFRHYKACDKFEQK